MIGSSFWAQGNELIDLKKFFQNELEDHAKVLSHTAQALEEPFVELVELCFNCIRNKNKIMFVGNGGSAADAQHLSTELTVRFSVNREAIAALALTTDTSTITAIGNDLGFDKIFARQIEAVGKKGDVLIVISTSGSSPNVIEAANQAVLQGISVASLTGASGGKIASIAKPVLCVPSSTTARIQEMHITLGQMLCNAIEHRLGVI